MVRFRSAFTLTEVTITLTIAAVAIPMLHDGVLLALRAQQRQRLYDRCASFLMQEVDPLIKSGASRASGTLSESDPPLYYEVASQELTKPAGVTKVTVTLDTRGFGQVLPPIVTYYFNRIVAEKPPKKGETR
jgi:prepilin-type N-terminal cleavage/methylation domain-containing protein